MQRLNRSKDDRLDRLPHTPADVLRQKEKKCLLCNSTCFDRYFLRLNGLSAPPPFWNAFSVVSGGALFLDGSYDRPEGRTSESFRRRPDPTGANFCVNLSFAIQAYSRYDERNNKNSRVQKPSALQESHRTFSSPAYMSPATKLSTGAQMGSLDSSTSTARRRSTYACSVHT